ARGNRHVAANDGVTAHEAFFHFKEVHRSTTALRAACRLAEQLGHRSLHIPDSHQIMSMLTVRGQNVVSGLDRRDRTDRDRLLTDIEVKEATHLAAGIRPRRLFFKAADANHIAVKRKHEISIHDNSYK